ncbi:MAG: adenylosuccinate lyase [Candidatus Lokiarchaeota archaeon]|nr:adenylosuccinate lyase [Candidatus Lokiarchaeota archaeon]
MTKVHPIEFRYFTEAMRNVFIEEAKLEKWMEVEAALSRAHAKLGNIPQDAADEITKKASLKFVKLQRVKEIEKEIHHDLMAMVKAMTEACEGDAGNYIHLGATSYDIEDTAMALQFGDALNILESSLKDFLKTLLNLADAHKKTITVGRTHGQQALPTTYGMKFAIFASEIYRNISRLEQTKSRILVGKMSGAVGTMASFGENGFKIQELVMKDLGLKPTMIANQIIQRDRHAEVLLLLGLVSGTLDKIAREIRNLARTEFGEVSEPFKKKQVGSSTMPHKRNPHKSERICGLARIIKSNVFPALENITLEHERDLTNSSPERIIIPESFILLDFMIHQLNTILKGLVFNYDNIKKNLEKTGGLIMAENIMLKLVEKGLGRQDAHEILRKSAMHAYNEEVSFKNVLLQQDELKEYITEKEIDEWLDPKNYIGTAVEQVEKVVDKLNIFLKE